MPLDDVSDSEEEKMDVSDSDEGKDLGDEIEASEVHGEPLAKRRALGVDGAIDGESAPRWSNPDPYSVLPPVEDSTRKRKDPVKLIRKAFKSVEHAAATENQVSANVDFISFDDGEDDAGSLSERHFSTAPQQELKILLDLGADTNFIQFAQSDGYGPIGSRKRTHDDVIKRDGRPSWVSSSNPTGSLLDDWVPQSASTATPWLTTDATSSVKKAGFRLHREICDFYDFVRPRPYEQIVREELLSRLQTAVEREFPGCKLPCTSIPGIQDKVH